MKKYIKKIFKYPIVGVFIAILIMSAASWCDTEKKIMIIMKKDSTQQTADIKTNEENKKDDDKNNRLSERGLISFVDSSIKSVNSLWTISHNSLFSKVDSLFTYKMVGEIVNSQVLNGSDKWLFYKSKTDGDSIADYEGTNSFTTDELKQAIDKSKITQNEVEKRGIKFEITIIPNKENIYSEYMPETYKHSEISRTDNLIKKLKENGVNVVSPKQELLDNHINYQLYYYYDTHWNQLGAYIGVKDVLAEWNIQMPNLSECSIHKKNLRENYHYCGVDDLAQMVGLISLFDDEIEYEVDKSISMDWKRFETEQNNFQISHFTNKKARQHEKILLVGDSFRSSMIPSLSQIFSDVYVVHRDYYSENMLDEIGPDYLIAEYVERYSEEILTIDDLVE